MKPFFQRNKIKKQTKSARYHHQQQKHQIIFVAAKGKINPDLIIYLFSYDFNY